MKWGEFNTFHSTQNPLQCSFHTLSVLCMNGNTLGRRAVAPQRRLQESHGIQEVRTLQEVHQKVDVCDARKRDFITEAILSALRATYILDPFGYSHFCHLCSHNSCTLRHGAVFLCAGIYWFFQQCTLTGRYEIQLFLFWLKIIPGKRDLSSLGFVGTKDLTW